MGQAMGAIGKAAKTVGGAVKNGAEHLFGDAEGGATIPVAGPEGAIGPEMLDPNQGLSKGNIFARKALRGGLMGGGSAMQQQGQGQQRSGAPMDMSAFQSPELNLGNDSNYLIQAKKRFDPFYGGQ